MNTIISEPIYDIQVEQNVPVPMRDGTILRADVYQPQAEGRYPVLVGRVGYKLRDWVMDFYTPMGEYYARRGYVVVWQNVRGTFASEGRFHPYWDDAWGANRDGASVNPSDQSGGAFDMRRQLVRNAGRSVLTTQKK